MGAPRLIALACAKCGFLFIHSATGRARKGWVHHDGTRSAQTGQPNWCRCMARVQVRRELQVAILAAEKVGGRPAAQFLMDQIYHGAAKRDPDRIQRKLEIFAYTARTLRGYEGMTIIDDPMTTDVEITDERRKQIIDWFTRVMPRVAIV